MSVLNTIPITLKISYTHSAWSELGWPLCRITWDGETVANFKADGSDVEFTVDPKMSGTSELVVEHYGKNYYVEHDKFIEITGMQINSIDVKTVLWESTQYPITAPWDEAFTQQGNLYLGHNGRIVWQFANPVLLDLQRRLGVRTDTQEGQETTKAVLNEVRAYFEAEHDRLH